MNKKDEPLSYEEAINKAANAIYRFPLIEVQGVPLMNWVAQNWSSVWAFCPNPSDLLISTYPKAGTTWTQEIVDLLLHNGDAEICGRAPTVVRSPFLEMNSPPPIPSEGYCVTSPYREIVLGRHTGRPGMDLLKTMKPPRLIKTHLPIQLVPEGFWENKCKNPRREIVRIMQYLDLSLSDDIINKVMELTSFNVMKNNPMANYSFIPKPVFDNSISAFMRKGEVGDWTNYFTPAQSQMFDEDYARQMADVDIPFRTNI
ncbi:sulfotransferase 1C2 isoform X3 [Neoarius graeffei]|uniref:sulfotransferase 1C2 isoform X3 n=1 Tax=Neoarius graeffei TaxID=443677 RepID=UPI00298C518D|nr:sulfotransferase 1C2 isoform X3 [Neoarius graeffei]